MDIGLLDIVALALGAVAGAGLGWFSYRHQALFLAGAGSTLGLLGLLGKQFAPLLKITADLSQESAASLPALLFGALPEPVQQAMMLAFIVGVFTRIATWYHARFVVQHVAETKAERRARILKDYEGYHDLDIPTPGTSGRSASPAAQPASHGRQDIRSLAGLR